MKTKQTVLFLLLIVFSSGIIYSQHNPVEMGLNAITKDAVKAQLEFLASDWTEGRETSTKGEFLAGDYIASIFKYIGLKPAGDFETRRVMYVSGQAMPKQQPPSKTFFQNINFVENISSESSLELISKEGTFEERFVFNQGIDYSFYGTGVGREYTAPLIFVGYGLKIEELGIDDFKGVDLKGKVVLCYNGFPSEFNDPNSEVYKKIKP